MTAEPESQGWLPLEPELCPACYNIAYWRRGANPDLFIRPDEVLLSGRSGRNRHFSHFGKVSEAESPAV